MHIGSLGAGADRPEYYAKEQLATQAQTLRQRTIREQLQDRITGHEAQIVTLREALDALTPDVEKALNALAKV